MKSYRTVIAFPYPEPFSREDGTVEYINRTKYLPIDFLDDRSITADSRIITQPLQSGDTMSDHMYREPVKMTLKGKFALNGRNWNNDSYNFLFQNDRLTTIEYVFEYIKNAGILCTLTTVESEIDDGDKIYYDENGNLVGSSITPSKTRFLTRENMALTNINWTEKVNVLEFSFSFQEVIMIDMIEYEVDSTDLTLPSLNEPRAQGEGNVLWDTQELPKMITQMLAEKGYIKSDWAEALATRGDVYGVYAQIVASVAIAIGLIAATVAITGALLSAGATLGSAVLAFPVGTVVAVAAVAITFIALAIKHAIDKKRQREVERRAFKLINNSPSQDFNRYMNLMDDIEEAVNSAGSNLSIYSFSSDDEQEITLTIGGNYYYISFTKTSVFPFWKTDVRLNAPATKEGSTSISNMRMNPPSIVTNFTELNENVNMWFKDESKSYQVYLVNSSLDDEYNSDQAGKNNAASKLSNYSIWVSKGSIKENVKKIEDAINNTLLSHDFD